MRTYIFGTTCAKIYLHTYSSEELKDEKIFFQIWSKNQLLFAKNAFLPEKVSFRGISADFVTGFEKFFFSSESSSDKDAKRCKYFFLSSSGFGDIHEKQSLNKQLDSAFC